MNKSCRRSFAVCCLLTVSVQATLMFPSKPTWMQKYRMKKSLLAAKNSGLQPPPVGYADYAALAQPGYMAPYPAALVAHPQIPSQARTSTLANYYVPTPALTPFQYRWNFAVPRTPAQAPLGTNNLAPNPMMQFAYVIRSPYIYGNNLGGPLFGYPAPVALRAAPIQYSNDIRTPAAPIVPLVPETNLDTGTDDTSRVEVSEDTYSNDEQQPQQQQQQQQQPQQTQQQEQTVQETNSNNEKPDEYSYPSDSALNRLRRVAKKKNARNQNKQQHHHRHHQDEEEDDRRSGPAALGFQPMPINSRTMLDAEEELERSNFKTSNYRERDYSSNSKRH